MEKKKAIKIVTATAIAASAFTAVAPTQSEAAVSVAQQISASQKAMKKPYDTYTKAGKLASASDVKKQIASAKSAQAKANTAIKNSKDSAKVKNANYAKIKSYGVYITRAQGYVDAITLNTRAEEKALDAAIKGGKLEEVTDARAALNSKLYKYNKAVAKVYSQAVRDLLNKTYAVSAKEVNAEAIAFIGYAETLKAVTEKVDAYVAATADLKTQAQVDAAKTAKAAIDLKDIKDADKTALQTKIDAADKAVTDAEAALAVPAVESVSAINATEIKVVFNKELNKDSAQTAANYEILVGYNAVAPVSTANYRAVLQDDKKTVILQFGTGSFTPVKSIEDGQTYKVNVKADKVLTSDYKPVTEYKGTAGIFSDKVNPKLVKSELSGATLTLTFDERVNTIGSLKVDGVTVPTPSYTTDAGKYTVSYNLTDADMLKSGTHNIALYSVADYTGNSEVLINSTYVATANNVKPSVEKVEALSTNKFRVTFASAVNAPTAANFEVKKGNYTFPVAKIGTPVQYGTSGKVWDVTISDNGDIVNPLYATGENSVNLSVAVKDYKGTNNVFGDTFTTNVTLSKDTVKPVVQNAAINSATGSTLTVIFNEELDNATSGSFTNGVDVSKINVSKDGVKLTGFTATVNATDKKKVDITLASPVADGTYSVTFGDSSVRDLADNKNAAQSTTVAAKVLSGTVFQPNTIGVTQVSGQNKITVTYFAAPGTKMTNSAVDLANYKLDGVPLNSPLFAGADIAFTDTNKRVVEITLPKGQFVSGTTSAVLEISKNVQDENGVAVAKADKTTYTSGVLTGFADDVAPTLQSAEYVKQNASSTSTNALKLTFSENVTATDVQDFLVNIGGTKVNVSDIVTGTNTKEVIVKLGTSVNLSQSATVAITTDKTYNTNDVINIVDGASNKATAKQVTLSSSVVDATAYSNTNPGAPVAPATTFAFDGANAGKLMGATTAHEFSLDGGTTWVAVTSADQALTAPQLASVTATNDIKVRVAASGLTPVGTAQTLDVQAAPAAPTVTLANGNSATDTLTGAATDGTQEVTVDGGTTWATITGATTVDSTGAAVIQVRVKATGLTLAGTATANLN